MTRFLTISAACIGLAACGSGLSGCAWLKGQPVPGVPVMSGQVLSTATKAKIDAEAAYNVGWHVTATLCNALGQADPKCVAAKGYRNQAWNALAVVRTTYAVGRTPSLDNLNAAVGSIKTIAGVN